MLLRRQTPSLPRTTRARRAFTLVELLVVIGIVAVLVAVILAATARARRTAVRVACAATLRQYAAAQQMYLNEYRDWYVPVKWGFNTTPDPPWPPPPAGLPAPTIPHASWPRNVGFRRALGLKTINQSRVPYGLVCRSAVLSIDGANKSGYEPARSYGYNSTGLKWHDGPTIYYTGFKRKQVRRPALKLMFVDATSAAVSGGGSEKYETLGEVYGPPTPTSQTGITAYRHERGANVAFFDGHVEWLHKKQIIKNDALWAAKK